MSTLQFYQALSGRFRNWSWEWLFIASPALAAVISGAMVWRWQLLLFSEAAPELSQMVPPVSTAAVVAFCSASAASVIGFRIARQTCTQAIAHSCSPQDSDSHSRLLLVNRFDRHSSNCNSHHSSDINQHHHSNFKISSEFEADGSAFVNDHQGENGPSNRHQGLNEPVNELVHGPVNDQNDQEVDDQAADDQEVEEMNDEANPEATDLAEIDITDLVEAPADWDGLDGRFVPTQFLQLLQRSTLAEVSLGDYTERTMAVMFADIRGFTTLSETMSPQENLRFLNAYLGRMERAIAQHNGFIDKYIGDAIMALFEGDADLAVDAAISMFKALSEYNQERLKAGRPAIRIGIGLDTGPLILGTIGGVHRMETTAIGDAVNLASRLEELTKQYSVSILVSHRLLAALHNPSKYSIRFIDRLYVRGRTQPVAVYEVLNADPIELQTLKRASSSLFEEGVLRFHRRQYREAASLFEECLSMNPTDRATHIYLQRSVLAGFPPSEHTWQLIKGKVIHKRKRYRGRRRARSR